MTNAEIAEALEQVADLLEFTGANAFRVRGYRNGARAIRDFTGSIAELVAEEGRKLTDIPGIGKGVAEKCTMMVETGELPQLKELLEKVPRSVLEMLRVPSLGPKKAAVLFNELNCASLADLRQACEQGLVRGLKGFGLKTEQSILEGLEVAQAALERIRWADADQLVAVLREHLASCSSINQLEFAGSYRRGRETVGDLDVLVDSQDAHEVMDHFAEFESVDTVIVRGGTKMSVRLETGLRVDLRVVAKESFGAALQYFTGSKEHNVELRGRARQLGLKINEYGVFRMDGEEESYIAGESEADVYATLDLPCFAPELREGRREFQWAAEDALPALIELGDIKGDLHMHTTATDGRASLREMVDAAIARELEYIAVTDHSKRVMMAGGLDADRLREQWATIDQLNTELEGQLVILRGIECDILEDGPLDLDDKVLSEADWVLASVHYGQNQSRQQITDRVIGALRNPHVCAIAHPTGRLLNRRPPYEIDLTAVLEAARDEGKMMELNASPSRLDLDDVFCATAKELGIPIVINTDAHSIPQLDRTRFGIKQARRAGLTATDVANTRSLPEFRELIGR